MVIQLERYRSLALKLRELKPILGVYSQSLEGTFKHTGSVRCRVTESKYLRAENTRTLALWV